MRGGVVEFGNACLQLLFQFWLMDLPLIYLECPEALCKGIPSHQFCSSLLWKL